MIYFISFFDNGHAIWVGIRYKDLHRIVLDSIRLQRKKPCIVGWFRYFVFFPQMKQDSLPLAFQLFKHVFLLTYRKILRRRRISPLSYLFYNKDRIFAMENRNCLWITALKRMDKNKYDMKIKDKVEKRICFHKLSTLCG